MPILVVCWFLLLCSIALCECTTILTHSITFRFSLVVTFANIHRSGLLGFINTLSSLPDNTKLSSVQWLTGVSHCYSQGHILYQESQNKNIMVSSYYSYLISRDLKSFIKMVHLNWCSIVVLIIFPYNNVFLRIQLHFKHIFCEDGEKDKILWHVLE